MPSNSLFNWISKYRYPLFRISRYPKIESENDSSDYIQDIKITVGKYKDIENDFYSNDSLNDDLESRF